MALDLEIAGAVEVLSAPDDVRPSMPRPIARLRDSHQQVAKLIAAGLRTHEVCQMTGYSISRLSWMQNNDPAFRELVEVYRQDKREVEMDVEARIRMVALDGLQEYHERMLDDPESISTATIADTTIKLLDRAGYAPITRSVNKNLNLNIGAKFDRALENK